MVWKGCVGTSSTSDGTPMFVAEVPAASGQNPLDPICPSPTATQSICRHPDLFANSLFTAAEVLSVTVKVR